MAIFPPLAPRRTSKAIGEAFSPQKRTHFQTWNFLTFFYFHGSFLPSWIRIHWPDWIRIRNTALDKCTVGPGHPPRPHPMSVHFIESLWCQTQAKTVRKTLIATVLWLFWIFFSLKTYVNVPSKSNKKKNFFKISFLLTSWRSVTKIAGSGYESGSESGYISQRHGSADPDPHQNVMDPEHTRLNYVFYRRRWWRAWWAGWVTPWVHLSSSTVQQVTFTVPRGSQRNVVYLC